MRYGGWETVDIGGWIVVRHLLGRVIEVVGSKVKSVDQDETYGVQGLINSFKTKRLDSEPVVTLPYRTGTSATMPLPIIHGNPPRRLIRIEPWALQPPADQRNNLLILSVLVHYDSDYH